MTYVYVVEVDGVPVYVGKGSGRRCQQSARRHGGTGRILERFDSDDAAFKAEVRYIAELMPTENRAPGGGGGRCRPKPKSKEQKWAAAFAKYVDDGMRDQGPRRFVARELLRLGLAKVGGNSLEEVANGEWC